MYATVPSSRISSFHFDAIGQLVGRVRRRARRRSPPMQLRERAEVHRHLRLPGRRVEGPFAENANGASSPGIVHGERHLEPGRVRLVASASRDRREVVEATGNATVPPRPGCRRTRQRAPPRARSGQPEGDAKAAPSLHHHGGRRPGACGHPSFEGSLKRGARLQASSSAAARSTSARREPVRNRVLDRSHARSGHEARRGIEDVANHERVPDGEDGGLSERRAARAARAAKRAAACAGSRRPPARHVGRLRSSPRAVVGERAAVEAPKSISLSSGNDEPWNVSAGEGERERLLRPQRARSRRRGRSPRRRAQPRGAGLLDALRREPLARQARTTRCRRGSRPANACRARRSVSTRLEEQRAVVEHVLHPDRLVQPNRRDRSRRGRTGRRSGRSRAAGGRGPQSPRAPYPLWRTNGSTQTCWSWTAVGRPRGGLGLEEDHAVLDPEPRPPLLDLAARAPAEALRVAPHRIDAELLLVRGGAGGHEELEVVERRRAQRRVARRRAARGSRRRAGPDDPRADAAAASAPRPRAPTTARASPMSMRGAARATSRAKPPQPSPDGTDVDARRGRARRARSPSASATKRPRPAPRDVLEEDALDRDPAAQKRRICSRLGSTSFGSIAGQL